MVQNPQDCFLKKRFIGADFLRIAWDIRSWKPAGGECASPAKIRAFIKRPQIER